MNLTSIYVHVPFCRKKCNYCAFNSKSAKNLEISNYVDALTQEIKNFPENLQVDTVYFGGGTPTILKISQLEKIFNALIKKFSVKKNSEITIEANPCTLNKIFLQDLKKIGFNRLSVGVQSFNDKILKILGRLHDSKIAKKNILDAKNFFANINVDLMYGLPEQTLENLQDDLKIISALDVQHISVYGLEIEEGTKFFDEKNILNLPDDEIISEMYDFITEILPNIGYNRYEISNFAKKNFESRHNLGYWSRKKYFGFGAGAHSYNRKIRTSNICNVEDYIRKIFSGEDVSQIEEILTEKTEMEEFCFLGLRKVEGISIKNFYETFNKNFFEIFGAVIKKNISLGLLKNCDDKIFLTERGMKFGNIVFADFLI